MAQSRARSRQRPRSVRRPGSLPSSTGGAWGPSRESRVRRRHLWGETPGRSTQPLSLTVRCRPDSALRFGGESSAVHNEPGALQPPPALVRSPARPRAGWGRDAARRTALRAHEQGAQRAPGTQARGSCSAACRSRQPASQHHTGTDLGPHPQVTVARRHHCSRSVARLYTCKTRPGRRHFAPGRGRAGPSSDAAFRDAGPGVAAARGSAGVCLAGSGRGLGLGAVPGGSPAEPSGWWRWGRRSVRSARPRGWGSRSGRGRLAAGVREVRSGG